MKTTWRLAIAISVLATIVVAPVARAGTIVPGESIDGVRLLMSQDAVKRLLGPPDFVNHGKWVWHARGKSPTHDEILVEFVHRKVYEVNSLWVPGKGKAFDRTAEGIGLGSTMSAADRAYPGQCHSSGTPGAPPGCSWQWNDTGLVFWFDASGRYGKGWKAPVEVIGMKYRCQEIGFERCLRAIREYGGIPPGY